MEKKHDKLFVFLLVVLGFIANFFTAFSLKCLRGDGHFWLSNILADHQFHHDHPTTRLIIYLYQVIPVFVLNFFSEVVPIEVSYSYGLNYFLISQSILLYFVCKYLKDRDRFYLFAILSYFITYIGVDSYACGVSNLSVSLAWIVLEKIKFRKTSYDLFLIAGLSTLLIFTYDMSFLFLPLFLWGLYKSEKFSEKEKKYLGLILFSVLLYMIFALFYTTTSYRKHVSGGFQSLKNLPFFLFFQFIFFALICKVKERIKKKYVCWIGSLILCIGSYLILEFIYNGSIVVLATANSYHFRVYSIPVTVFFMYLYNSEKLKISKISKVCIVLIATILVLVSGFSSMKYNDGMNQFRKLLTSQEKPCMIFDQANLDLIYGNNQWNDLYKSLNFSGTNKILKIRAYRTNLKSESCLLQSYSREIYRNSKLDLSLFKKQ
ncbi:hypothetical protein [Bacteriovorax sp. Seq25_V]|uniref:hypothetical protein n=1 Tax=Bacteriovorax sp. Seq25_V TaxID=1201288 RepID=UPI000389F155|nr:hypothetical protein [Bacteriovorax sp. Seq25_V]EQC45391.1 putative membrane protein [Bacteriovorax sp. Seq25_V]